jgi:hypothetical protein
MLPQLSLNEDLSCCEPILLSIPRKLSKRRACIAAATPTVRGRSRSARALEKDCIVTDLLHCRAL